MPLLPFGSAPFKLTLAKINAAIGALGGDLSGSLPDPTVVGIQGVAVDSSAATPASNTALVYAGKWYATAVVNSFGTGGGRRGAVVPTVADYIAAPLGGITGALGPFRIVGATTGGPPITGTFLTGDVILDTSAALTWYYCTAGGSPGTWTNFPPYAASTVTGPDAFGASAAVGTLKTFAREDHDHGLPSIQTTGWVPDTHTWTYASAAAPTYTITTPDASATLLTLIGPGDKFLCTNQSASQYFIVTAISNNGTLTTLTLYGGTNYTLTNTAITNPFYGHGRPFVPSGTTGFDVEAAWRVAAVNNTLVTVKSGPTVGTWYDSGLSLVVPMGSWRISFQANAELTTASGSANVICALSTSASSISDQNLAAFIYAGPTTVFANGLSRWSPVTLAAPATYHLILNVSADTATPTTLYVNGGNGQTVLEALNTGR